MIALIHSPIMKPDYSKVRHEVSHLLNNFGLTEPPVNPVSIARDLGINVVFAVFSPDLDRVSGFYDAEEDTIYVNKNEYPLRQTFTIAHELGHRVLHAEWAKSTEYKVLLRDDIFNDDPVEKEANAFAAHLLVPRFMLDKYWKDTKIEKLSELFAVSVPVIQNRISFEYGT
jgi:Zn-dependent peptidase ImmA (M78 family)